MLYNSFIIYVYNLELTLMGMHCQMCITSTYNRKRCFKLFITFFWRNLLHCYLSQ